MLLWELRKFRSRGAVIFLTAMLILNILCVFVSEYDRMTPEGRLIQEKQSQLFTSYAETPEEFGQAYSSYRTKLSDYERMLRVAPYIGGDVTPWENTVISLPGYGDRELYRDVMGVLSGIENYSVDMDAVLAKAYSELNDIGEIRSGEYEYEYQVELILHYEKLKALDMEAEPVIGWDTLFKLRSPLILLTITLICLSPQFFLIEKNTKFYPILTTTRKGRLTTSVSKVMCAFLYTSVLTLLFSLTPMAVIAYSTGFSSPDQYVQAIESLRLCPYALTVVQYLIITLLHRVMMVFALSLFTMLVSKVSGSHILSVCVLSLYMVFSIAVYGTEHHVFSYFAVADTNYLFERFRALNIGGGFLQLIPYCALSASLSAAVWFLLILLLPTNAKEYRLFSVRKLHLIRRKHSVKEKIQPHIHSLFYWESVKVIFTKPNVFLLICLLIVRFLVQANYFTPSMRIDEVQYRKYIHDIQDLGGTAGSESDFYLDDQQDYINSAYSDFFAALGQIKSKQITAEEMHQHNMRYNYALSVSPALTRLQTQRNYLSKQAQFTSNLGYVNEDGITRILSPDFDVIFVLILLLLLPPSFSSEYSHSFHTLLRTTKKGRSRTWLSKYGSLIGFFGLLYVLFAVMDFCLLCRNYGTGDLRFSIQSIQAFEQIGTSVPIGTYIVLSKLFGLIGCECIVITFTGLSAVCKSTPVCISVLFIICFLPEIFSLFGIGFLNTVSVTNILHPLFLKNTFTLVLLFAAAVTGTILSYHSWNSGNTPKRKIILQRG